MGRKKIVAGNWKMNKELLEGLRLSTEIIRRAGTLAKDSVEVVIAPPAVYLHTAISMGERVPQIKIAAQNCHHKLKGAYTGEISAPMLKSMKIDYAIIGHSERRKYFGEDHAILAEKVNTVLETGMAIIFCCGEPLEVREAGEQEKYVLEQLQQSLFQLTAEQMESVVIAYEPVWAIGTGKTATPQQAQDMHAYIRKEIESQYNETVADNISILYGGSVKPSNAADIFANPDVDGGLIGGASLQTEDFMAIVQARLK
jgi:triosephosphate isomerase